MAWEWLENAWDWGTDLFGDIVKDNAGDWITALLAENPNLSVKELLEIQQRQNAMNNPNMNSAFGSTRVTYDDQGIPTVDRYTPEGVLNLANALGRRMSGPVESMRQVGPGSSLRSGGQNLINSWERGRGMDETTHNWWEPTPREQTEWVDFVNPPGGPGGGRGSYGQDPSGGSGGYRDPNITFPGGDFGVQPPDMGPPAPGESFNEYLDRIIPPEGEFIDPNMLQEGFMRWGDEFLRGLAMALGIPGNIGDMLGDELIELMYDRGYVLSNPADGLPDNINDIIDETYPPDETDDPMMSPIPTPEEEPDPEEDIVRYVVWARNQGGNPMRFKPPFMSDQDWVSAIFGPGGTGFYGGGYGGGNFPNYGEGITGVEPNRPSDR